MTNPRVKTVTMKSNFFYDLITVLTLGFASPIEVEWYCAPPNPNGAVVPEPGVTIVCDTMLEISCDTLQPDSIVCDTQLSILCDTLADDTLED